jgi:hypothetical protein
MPGPVVAPTVEVALHGRTRGKSLPSARHWQPVART